MSVAAIIERAGMSRKTFYEEFANRDECFTAVVEQIFTRARSVMSAAYDAEGDWLEGVRSALDGLLCLIDEDPRIARVWFVDAMAGPEEVQERRAEAAAMLAAAVEAGRAVADERRQPPLLTGEAIVGGISQVIRARLLEGGQERFAELLGPCMYLIVLPYLGASRAAIELGRGSSMRKASPEAADPLHIRTSLREMNVRFTYRTITVLNTIGERAGASNRAIAEDSGVKDQGQISKLLSRLEKLALIENRGSGQTRGASNSWHLTSRGHELVRTTSGHELRSGRGSP